MKKLITYILSLWATQSLGQAFITTWNTAGHGISQPHQITIPTSGSGFNYSIYWEDTNDKSNNGTIPGPITGSYTISFPSGPGIYRISITGSFPRIFFN